MKAILKKKFSLARMFLSGLVLILWVAFSAIFPGHKSTSGGFFSDMTPIAHADVSAGVDCGGYGCDCILDTNPGSCESSSSCESSGSCGNCESCE